MKSTDYTDCSVLIHSTWIGWVGLSHRFYLPGLADSFKGNHRRWKYSINRSCRLLISRLSWSIETLEAIKLHILKFRHYSFSSFCQQMWFRWNCNNLTFKPANLEEEINLLSPLCLWNNFEYFCFSHWKDFEAKKVEKTVL